MREIKRREKSELERRGIMFKKGDLTFQSCHEPDDRS